jgi:ABC-2 type transport system ATP-binding protein
MELVVNNISKQIKNRTILSNINLHLTSGMIYGFVGPNGSGKTMLFRAISGLMKPSSGEVWLDGKLLHKDMRVLPNLGIVIENAGLYPELSGFDNLKLLAKLNGKINDNDIREAIKKVGLDPNDKRPFRKYSLGMKQRIVLAQAIMEKPDTLLLDEPTNALDEDGIRDIRNIILEEKSRGALVLIASHNKDDIELLADKVFMVKNGFVSEGGESNEA